MSQSLNILNINGLDWQIKQLGSEAILLEPKQSVELSIIHYTAAQIYSSSIQGVIEVVPAYQSIAVFFDIKKIVFQELILNLKSISFSKTHQNTSTTIHKIPVCFELGLDWDEVSESSQLDKRTFIKKFIAKTYTVAMLGFIPGFMYLDGLEDVLHCPRKQNPRKFLPAGAVGIGGGQTGIYALSSPGGWQIIGQTPITLFKKSQMPPTEIQPMDKVEFYEIDLEMYNNHKLTL